MTTQNTGQSWQIKAIEGKAMTIDEPQHFFLAGFTAPRIIHMGWGGSTPISHNKFSIYNTTP